MNTLPATATPTTLAQGKNIRAGFFSVASFELMQRVATGFSRSSLVPKAYQNNVPNCMIAISMADRIGADPLMVMQSLNVIHGKPTWSAQFLIATANTCGRFEALEFDFIGDKGTDGWGCRAVSIEKAKQRKLVGPDVTIAMAKKEGWYDKDGSKWKTMPQLMLMYRAGAFWVRAFAPELSLGLQTAEEAADILDATPTASGAFQVLEEAKQQLGKTAPPASAEPPAEPPEAASTEESTPVETARPVENSALTDDEAEGFGSGVAMVPQHVQDGLNLSAKQFVHNAIENLEDPDFKTVEEVEDYGKRIRATLMTLSEISSEERMKLIGEFNGAVLDKKRRVMPRGRR